LCLYYLVKFKFNNFKQVNYEANCKNK
jgi:hypothetical protein